MAMVSAAERMKSMRQKRREVNSREIRLHLPDARSDAVRVRISEQVKALDAVDEQEAMRWIEAVSDFDIDATR